MKKFILIFLITICSIGKSQPDTAGVYQMLVDYEIKHPKIVFAQMMYESGWLECKNCSWSEANNPFGFLICTTKVDGVCKEWKYESFCTLEESIEYYKSWQDKLYKGGDYYAFLKRIGYATYEGYNKRLESIYNQIWK